ncbi:hypothetical protein [Vibrio palustris]|uniref:Uncharacterized protein n=1 Tax=Vibrio palustris TaxID=1918946 RepID=A0A1R4B5F6_9VIBR|nr:hypothetical protein [Vibrio palustris]SJL84139.1 hypothetical protein VPAL9027_02120 [Vibrio palustris]
MTKKIKVTLAESSLSNTKALEYQWVRSLYVEGYSPHQINHYIQQCFGGDDTFADLFRKVAMYEESLLVLMQYWRSHFMLPAIHP